MSIFEYIIISLAGAMVGVLLNIAFILIDIKSLIKQAENNSLKNNAE